MKTRAREKKKRIWKKGSIDFVEDKNKFNIFTPVAILILHMYIEKESRINFYDCDMCSQRRAHQRKEESYPSDMPCGICWIIYICEKRARQRERERKRVIIARIYLQLLARASNSQEK